MIRSLTTNQLMQMTGRKTVMLPLLPMSPFRIMKMVTLPIWNVSHAWGLSLF